MVDLAVPMRMMKAVLGQMKEQKSGVIVNAGSYSSDSGATAGVVYAAGKQIIAGATKNVAWRFRKEGIRCNTVLPGSKTFSKWLWCIR